jgi:hypothetical protein
MAPACWTTTGRALGRSSSASHISFSFCTLGQPSVNQQYSSCSSCTSPLLLSVHGSCWWQLSTHAMVCVSARMCHVCSKRAQRVVSHVPHLRTPCHVGHCVLAQITCATADLSPAAACWCSRRVDSTVADVERRLAEWVQIPEVHGEDLQVCFFGGDYCWYSRAVPIQCV